MWIARLTLLITALAFISTVALVVLFVLAARGIALTSVIGQYGGWFFPIPFVLVVATYLMRYSAGLLMLRGEHHEAALGYCRPRSAVSLSVGRDEAGLNRYAAAEALRQLKRPREALTLLEAPEKPPWRRDVKQLLYAARVEALLDLERLEEAGVIVEGLSGEEAAGGAKRAVTQAIERFEGLKAAGEAPEG